MSRFQKSAILLVIMVIGRLATATTFVCSGKEMTKGEVIITLAKDSKVVCTKTDKVKLDTDKGTLKIYKD